MDKSRKPPLTHAEALAALAAPETVPARALKALSDLDELQLADTLRVWAEQKPERRIQLAERLTAMVDEDIEVDFNALFRGLLNDHDASVRAIAAEALSGDDSVANIDPLIRHMREDANEEVRATAARVLGNYLALGELGKLSTARRDQIYSALNGVWLSTREFTDVRRFALESLGYASNPAIETLIRDAYRSEDADIRVSAVRAMGHSSDNAWAHIALKELLNDDEEMRCAAAAACGEIELPDAVGQLALLIERDDALSPRLVAIDALSYISTREAQRALERAAASEEEEIAEAAEEALDTWEALNGEIEF
ncbi:MAG: HEAT repeat domain-containing protein [Thermoflexales bacterium]|nr:HEAT repeat domain-containing protein [Thermoflexales bacterium]